LNFDITVNDLYKKADGIIYSGRQVFDSVAAQTSPSFENTIVPIAIYESETDTDYRLLSLLQQVGADKAIRKASTDAERIIRDFETELYMREDVYIAMQKACENTKKIKKPDNEDKRLAASLLRRFRNHGFELEKSKRNRLAVIIKRITELEMRFVENINENKTEMHFTREELNGLDSDFIDSHPIVHKDDGSTNIVFTTRKSDYFTVLTQAKQQETRKKMFILSKTACPKNIELLEEAVKLRLELAKLFGYKTYAEYVLEHQMAKTPDNVMKMLNGLRPKLRDLINGRYEELARIKKILTETVNRPYEGLFSWDISYYESIRRELEHDIDLNQVKQYFPVEHSIGAILDIYQKLLGLQIVKLDGASVWHPDVDVYEVWESDDSKFIGHFYLDVYMREGKCDEASMLALRPGYQKLDGSREYPAVVMIANFSKPTSSAPALLDIDDIETFMHEMGHVFHEICSLTKWSKFHGTRVERDFAEVPSLMMENWCWETSVLAKISAHYETGDPIPSDLAQGLVNMWSDNALIDRASTIFYSLYDMAIHNTTDGNVDIVQLYNSMRKDILLYDDGDVHTFGVATVNHYMEGYDAAYYSYLWSEVYSADIFATRFLSDGLDNTQTGMDYRREILQPGGSRDAMVSLEHFLGRKPNSDAFF
ncbi:hypothetical protein BX070DRAFT_174977, partial [Coemansia spiralis]